MVGYKLRIYVVAVAQIYVLLGCGSIPMDQASSRHSSDSTAVLITPVQHMGKRYSVEDVYVNGQIGGGAGQLGGGGSMSCCILLPGSWRPGLVAEVRWSVLDWDKEDEAETRQGVFTSITKVGQYVAHVPVEYYKRPETLYVHFYPNGKARLVSSFYDAFDSRHPVPFDAEDGGLATAGKIVSHKKAKPGLAEDE